MTNSLESNLAEPVHSMQQSSRQLADAGVQRLRHPSSGATLSSWFKAHASCPACAVFRSTPCSPEFALYNAVRETTGKGTLADALGSKLDACVQANRWIVAQERAEPLIDQALAAPRDRFPQPDTSPALVRAAGLVLPQNVMRGTH
jgi:hypothetical protein